MPNFTAAYVIALLFPFVYIGVCLYSRFADAQDAKTARDIELGQVGTYERYWFPWQQAVAESEGLAAPVAGNVDGAAAGTAAAPPSGQQRAGGGPERERTRRFPPTTLRGRSTTPAGRAQRKQSRPRRERSDDNNDNDNFAVSEVTIDYTPSSVYSR